MNQQYREAIVLPLDQYEKLVGNGKKEQQELAAVNKDDDDKEDEEHSLSPLARSLLNHAASSAYFDCDIKNGRLILAGQHIPGSNIWDILTVVSSEEPIEFPSGLKEFLQLLAYDTPMATLILPYKQFRDYITGCRHEYDKKSYK